jgi:ribosome-binding factor A
MSHRLAQIESTLLRALAGEIRRLADPRIAGLVSVTSVRISPDLYDATATVSVLPAKYEKRTLAGLRHATGRMREAVGRHLAMKRVPRLHFQLDASLKKQADVMAAIRRGLAREGAPMQPEAGAGDPAGEAPIPTAGAGAQTAHRSADGFSPLARAEKGPFHAGSRDEPPPGPGRRKNPKPAVPPQGRSRRAGGRPSRRRRGGMGGDDPAAGDDV